MAKRILHTYASYIDPKNTLDKDDIEKLCCEGVDVDPCSEYGRVSDYEGVDFEPPNLATLAKKYPGKKIINVHAVAVGRDGPCGKKYESWSGRLSCCDGVEPLSIDHDSTPDILPAGKSIIVYFNGGVGPFTITTSSNATAFSDGHKKNIITGKFFTLLAGETFCGATSISIADACSSVSQTIRSSEGVWQPISGECLFPGCASEYTSFVDSNGSPRIGYGCISGNLMQLEDLAIRKSHLAGYQWGYNYGIFYFPAADILNTCPSFATQAICTDNPQDILQQHCTCAGLQGLPDESPLQDTMPCSVRPLPPDDGLLAYGCNDTMWVSYEGGISIACGNFGGSTSRYAANWYIQTSIQNFRWVCR